LSLITKEIFLILLTSISSFILFSTYDYTNLLNLIKRNSNYSIIHAVDYLNMMENIRNIFLDWSLIILSIYLIARFILKKQDFLKAKFIYIKKR